MPKIDTKIAIQLGLQELQVLGKVGLLELRVSLVLHVGL